MTDDAAEVTVHVELPPPPEPEPEPVVLEPAAGAANVAALLAAEQRATQAEAEVTRVNAILESRATDDDAAYQRGFEDGKQTERETEEPEPIIVEPPVVEPEELPEPEPDAEPETAKVHPFFRSWRDWFNK